jgi:hypothetical protein
MKAVNLNDLPRPVKMILRTRDKQSSDTGEALRCIKDLNPGHSTEDWWVIEAQLEQRGQQLILLMDRDSCTAVKKTG